MYLGLLNEEKRELFLDICFCIASADGDYSADEKVLIVAYQKEMNTEYDPTISKKEVSEIIQLLNAMCTNKEKKIIIFETIGLALVDGNYDKTERTIIEQMAKTFEIKESYTKECEQLLEEYLKLQNRINQTGL